MDTKVVEINGKKIVVATKVDESYMEDEILLNEDLEKTQEINLDDLEKTQELGVVDE